MESFLVMKNNLYRRFIKFGTYVSAALIPILIVVAATIMTHVGRPLVTVGVCGSNEWYTRIKQELTDYDSIKTVKADPDSIHTDQILGTYQYVLYESVPMEQTKGELALIQQSAAKEQPLVNSMSDTERMLSMLMTVFLILAPLYASRYIQDKKDGTLERYVTSGRSKRSYLVGYFSSTATITGIQIAVTILCWKLFFSDFALSVAGCILVWIFLTIVVNLFGVAVAAGAKSDLSASLIASSVAVVLAVLGGTFISIDAMPHFLQTLSAANPIQWMLKIAGI